MFFRTFSCLLNVWIILKLNAKQVSDETVLAHIPSFKQMLHIFFWQMPNVYPFFNIPTCFNISLVKFKLFLNRYYLLTSFLHIGYLEKRVTMRIYPRNCFVPLPALTDVWNWALRPQHSDWVPKSRHINFTNVIFKKTVCSNFEPSHLLHFGGPWQGLYSLPLPYCSMETLLPSPRLSSSSSRQLHCCYSCRMVEVKRNPGNWVVLLKGGSTTAGGSGLLPGEFHVFPTEDTPQPVLVLDHLLALGAEKEEQVLQNWEASLLGRRAVQTNFMGHIWPMDHHWTSLTSIFLVSKMERKKYIETEVAGILRDFFFHINCKIRENLQDWARF